MKLDKYGRTQEQLDALKSKQPTRIDLIITARHKCVVCDYDKCTSRALTLPISLKHLNSIIPTLQAVFDKHEHRVSETIRLDSIESSHDDKLLDNAEFKWNATINGKELQGEN